MSVNSDVFKGRQLILEEIPPEYRQELSKQKLKQSPTMKRDKQLIQCLRCGTVHVLRDVRLGQIEPAIYYCPTCILMGRIQSNQHFYYRRESHQLHSREIVFSWDGMLAPSQIIGSRAVEQALKEHSRLLIHGVTGAGKTEMLFAGILMALRRGERICLASPRVDVCLELYPRLQKVFPELDIMLLYGKQKLPYHHTPLVVCTTHQLLRFKKAFDVVIVDEIDAFPFNQEKFLAYGLAQARKRKSAVVYLTATPSKALLQEVRLGTLKIVKVPMRYHGQTLPVPESVWLWQCYQKIIQGQLPSVIRRLIDNQLHEQHLTLLFCPTIDLMLQLEKSIRKDYPDVALGSASAQDPFRHQKVLNIRKGEYQLFLTTTILERGVTFAGIDVIIIGSNHRVFNQGSLVQISGRVGRSPQAPTGHVYFVHDGWSRAMLLAKQQIIKFNELATTSEVVN